MVWSVYGMEKGTMLAHWVQLKGCLLEVLCGCQAPWTCTRGEAWEEMCADIHHPSLSGPQLLLLLTSQFEPTALWISGVLWRVLWQVELK